MTGTIIKLNPYAVTAESLLADANMKRKVEGTASDIAGQVVEEIR
jgi:hypothetical protein